MQPDGSGRRAAILGGLFLLALGLVFWKTDAPEPTEKRSEGALDEATMERFSFVQTDPEGWRWDLSAAHGHTVDGRTVVLKEVAMTIRPPDMLAIHVRADTGSVDLSTHDFSLKNEAAPIEVTSDDGPTLKTSALHWHDRTRTLTADRPVSLTGQTFHAQGDTLVVDFVRRQTHLKGSVRTTLHRKPAL